MLKNQPPRRVFGKSSQRLTGCSQDVQMQNSPGPCDQSGGGFCLANFRSTFFPNGRLSFDLTQRNHASGVKGEISSALENAFREAPQTGVHALGNRNLNIQPAIFIGSRYIGADIAEPCGVNQICRIRVLGEKNGAVFQSGFFCHGAVGVRNGGEIDFL